MTPQRFASGRFGGVARLPGHQVGRMISNLFGGGSARELLDSAPFCSELLYTAIPQRAASGTTGTFTRATTSTWPNNDGYMVTGVAGEIGFVGARREYNQISNGGSYKSEGAFNSWTKGGVPPTVTDGIAGPDGRLTAARVVFAGSGPGNAIYTVGANGTGRTGIISAQIRGDAAGTIRLLTSNSGAFIDAAVTTEWQRFTIPAFAMTNTDGVAFLRNDVGQLGTIYVADAMIKDVTAQTTQTAGEYVSVGVESAPYYHGSMVDGVKCFPTDLSGNPIPAATMLGYQAQGARTNLCLQSNAFTTTWVAAGTGTITQNVVGPDGGTTAWTINDTDGAAYYFIQSGNITVSASTAYTVSVFIKKTSSLTVAPLIELKFTGGVATYIQQVINTVSGTATNFSGSTAPTSVTVASFNNDFWRVSIVATSPVGTTTANVTLYPAINADASATGVVAAQGSAVFYGAQVELGSFASSYIATTTVAVTRNADVLTYSSAGNIDGTKGWCYAEFDVSNDSDGNQNIILGSDVAGVFPLYAQPSLGNVRTLDGTNAPIAQSAPMTGVRKGAGTWGGSTMQSAHNGVVSSTTAFDGNMEVTAVIRIGEDNAGNSHFFGTIKNLYIGQRQLSASELGAITS